MRKMMIFPFSLALPFCFRSVDLCSTPSTILSLWQLLWYESACQGFENSLRSTSVIVIVRQLLFLELQAHGAFCR